MEEGDIKKVLRSSCMPTQAVQSQPLQPTLSLYVFLVYLMALSTVDVIQRQIIG
jgi:hypothetical protein